MVCKRHSFQIDAGADGKQMHVLGRHYMLLQAKTGRNLLAIRSVQLAVDVRCLRHSSPKIIAQTIIEAPGSNAFGDPSKH